MRKPIASSRPIAPLPAPSRSLITLEHGQPRLCDDIITRIAERRTQGLSLRHALALERPKPISIEWWEKSLKARPQLIRVYLAREAECLLPVLEALRTAGKGEWQRYAWILERAFPEDYGVKQRDRGPAATVNVSLAIGIEESIRVRAAQRVLDRAKPAVIDVESDTQSKDTVSAGGDDAGNMPPPPPRRAHSPPHDTELQKDDGLDGKDVEEAQSGELSDGEVGGS